MIQRRNIFLLLLLLLAPFAMEAQSDYEPFVIYSGSNYMAHVKEGDVWTLTSQTNFGPECIWLSNTENYCFMDEEEGVMYYLNAEFGPGQPLKISTLPNASQLEQNGVGVDSANVHQFYFYNWDWGLALGRQLNGSDPCPERYHNDHPTQCWQCYWVVYDNGWKMSSEANYNIPVHAATFRKVKIIEHALSVTGASGGISNLTDRSVSYNPSIPAIPLSVNYFPYVDTIRPAYTTYLISDIVCLGTWPDRSCDSTWTVHNYYNNGDQQSNVPTSAIHPSHPEPDGTAYHWTLSGEGASYLSFSNSSDLLTTTGKTPNLYYLHELSSGTLTATLTLTVTYEDGATQTLTATVTINTTCGNPRSSVVSVAYDNVTISWASTSTATPPTYKVRYKHDDIFYEEWEETIVVTDANQLTISGLEYGQNYMVLVAALCSGASDVDWTGTDTLRFTSARTPKLQIGGAVFGGGRMANVNGNTAVSIINCDTITAVYGGNDIAGQVTGDDGSTIVIGNATTNDTMHIGSIYGGGNGYYAYSGNNPSNAVGTTVLTEKTFTSYAEVGNAGSTVTANGNIPSIKKTSITVSNDYAKIDSLFGGAKNAFINGVNDATTTNSITIDGGTIFALFGGNNYGGTLANVVEQEITVNMTSIDKKTNVVNGANSGMGRDFGIRYLFGGGNNVYSNVANIRMYGGQVDTLFGGGNNATVGAVDVDVDCRFSYVTSDWVEWDKTITKAVYDLKPSKDWSFVIDDLTYTGTDYTNLFIHRYELSREDSIVLVKLQEQKSTWDSIVIDNTYHWDNKGTYNIRCLFGGNNIADMDAIPLLELKAGGIGTVYGGGNQGAMTGHSPLPATIDGNSVTYGTHVKTLNNSTVFIDRIYGGCQQSDVDYSTWVDLNGGYMGYVFGGCNISGDVGSTRTNPSATESPDYYAVKGGCWVEMNNGQVIKNVFGGSDGYYHCNNDLRYISGVNYTDKNYVGLFIPTHNETHVYMTGGKVLGNVYAGGNLANVGFTPSLTATWNEQHYPITCGLASVHISGGKVVTNVFGGGNMASIYGINDVLVDGGEIDGALYGGNDRAGRVRKFNLRQPAETLASDGQTPKGEDITTYVKVTDNAYVNTVFGGGNGDYDYSENSNVQLCGDPNIIKPIQTGSFVDININDINGDDGGYVGTVYGGGDGVFVNGSITVFLNVKNGGGALSGKDNVGTIFGGNNKGDLTIVPKIILLKGQTHDVYGGSNQGNMLGYEERNIAGVVDVGSYVHLRNSYKPTPTSPLVTPQAVVSGNVYGGCRVSDVMHNTLVLVEGGDNVNARIFGGNDISGTVHGTANVIIDSTAKVFEVYGGGNGLYSYNGNGTVSVPSSTTGVDSILVTMPNPTRPIAMATNVKLQGGECEGAVYGGGLAGESGSTNMLVRGTTIIKGDLFGGGKGIVDSIGIGNYCAGAVVKHNHLASVKPMTQSNGSTTSGTSTVTLHSMDESSASDLHNVYGGGHNSNCQNTDVTILPTFRHSLNHLYGGCVAGNVYGGTNITVRNHDNGINTTVDTLFGGNDFSGMVGTTVITIDSGRFNNVFGGGNGNYKYGKWLTNKGFTLAEICVDTVPYSMNVTVNFNGGYYVGNVYGGGNLGLVGNRDMVLANMISSADSLTRDTNIGQITINIHKPSYFNRHVFAGARGLRDMKRTFFRGNTFTGTGHTGRNVNNSSALGKQLVYGQKIVNMDGGTINYSLYGGSESVDDGFPYECIGKADVDYYKESRITNPARGNHNSTMRPSTVLNLVGGNVRKNVYGSGYQGNGYGSVYVNIGRRAVNESPVWTKSYNGYKMTPYKPVIKNAGSTRTNPGELIMGEDLLLEASVYNGSDWGEAGARAYFNTRGFYGGETNILVDGYGYYTSVGNPSAELRLPTMTIAYSLIGSGISTEGGDVNRLITMRRYGDYYDCENVSRELYSIQRADKVVLDSVFIHLQGEQDAFSAYTSSNYTFNRIDTLIFRNDNIVSIEAPSTFIGNLVSMKPEADLKEINVQANLYTDLEMMTANLQSFTDNCSASDIHINCDELSFCDKLPVTRGQDGKPGKYNTLVMRNGCYVKVNMFVDEYNNNDHSIHEPDGKEDALHYGHVKGWMYMTSEDNTQSYVYAAYKTPSTNTTDGGFVGLCACENSSPFTDYTNELNYENIDNSYRTWHVGTYQGRRTRHVTLVANAEPDSVLNWRMKSTGTIPVNTDDCNLTPEATPYTISSSTGNDHLAYATTTMELPPAEDGNFYLLRDILIDQDNGNDMSLIDQVYDAATGTIFSPQTIMNGLDDIYNTTQELRNKTFGLSFSTQFAGSNFDQSSCWNVQGNHAPEEVTEPDGGRYLRTHTGPGANDSSYLCCWPITNISGNSYISSGQNFLSRAISGQGGVVPNLMFTLTYDTRLSNTLTRDVVFTLDEYDKNGKYVGPINVTVTINTVIKDFTDIDATVMAIYNEGVSNEYYRVVTLPSSFMERGLWLRGIEWENNSAKMHGHPIKTTTALLTGISNETSDFFFLQSVDKEIKKTTISDVTRYDNGKTYAGNNLFSLIVSPSEHSTDNTNNHLAWMDINEDARDLDVYQTALDDYKATNNISETDWDFTNTGDLAIFNKTRKYSSLNINEEATVADRDTTDLFKEGIYLGTLDGRSTAGIDIRLKYNGDYVYHDCYDTALGVVKLHLYWENTKYRNSELEEENRTDRGYITLTINLRTRKKGDTIYLAPGNSLTHTPLDHNGNLMSPVTVTSWHQWAQNQNPVHTLTMDERGEIINKPNRFLNNFREAMVIYIEGDVLDIMETLPISSSSDVATLHGDDYNRIQVIRYSGDHTDFPTLGCANKNAMIDVKGTGRLNLRNVWLNGSGCTRYKRYESDDITLTGRNKGIVLAHAPIIYCHEGGEVTLSSNVLLTNNFNIGQDSTWDNTNHQWIANTDNTYIRGGAIALDKDKASLKPKVVMGNNCELFDNVVMDWKSYYDANPPATENYKKQYQPLNYGGAIYMHGGLLQVGTMSSEGDNYINIARNFYIKDSNMTKNTRARVRTELGGGETPFTIYYLDTVRHPENFALSNIHLTRATKDYGDEFLNVHRDTLSDKVTYVCDFNNKSRVGINKWFPGYRYDQTVSSLPHYLNNSQPRDTICFAIDRSNKPRVAQLNYENKLFFNDSSYYFDNSKSQAGYYTGNPNDSTSARFVPLTKNYTSYSEGGAAYPSYKDQVWTLYSPYISKSNYYLQRCASFGPGMKQEPMEITETDQYGRQVTLHFNKYVPGDSIYYLWDKNATCVASTDTIVTMFGGGFFPYTYQWYQDTIIEDNLGMVDFHRIPVRSRTTEGDNSIATFKDADGNEIGRNTTLRYRASHDTMVLRSLVAKESSRKSTYFYTLDANDATGNCSAYIPVMIRVGKISSDDSSKFHHSGRFFIDSSNFLRHRNPYASYGWYCDSKTEDFEYYLEFPVCEDTLKNKANPEMGAEIKYSGQFLYNYDGTNYYNELPTLTPTERDALIASGDLYPNALLFKQRTDKDQNGDDSLWYWMEYNNAQNYEMTIYTTTSSSMYGLPTSCIPLGDYYYYRVSTPGVDSSSFHDKVEMGKVGDDIVFFNAKGDTLYPYIMGWNQAIETYDEYLAGKNRSDSVGYEIRKKIGGTVYRFRTDADHSSVKQSTDGTNWTAATAYEPNVETDFWPLRHVPHRIHGNVTNEVGSEGGIRRAGYSHVPMHWFNHGYNRGTLSDRIKAESFSGKPYGDNVHVLNNATFYKDAAKSEVIDNVSKKLYSGEMVPRYLRVYRAYHIYPDIYPADADSLVRAYNPYISDYETADLNGDTLDLKHDEFCPGDIVQLRPIAKTKSTRWPGESPAWQYVAWDFNASSDSIATFVVKEIRNDADSVLNQPVAYFAPGDYWWQHVTSLPSTSSYIRHQNGDVTIKDEQGLAWLISVVNGYNGQNARSFRYNKVTFDFDSVNMSRYRWTPVGNRNNHFEGTIEVPNGRKGIITGITASESTVSLMGMFGYANRAKLNGITLDSILVRGTSYVGAVAGFADTNTEVQLVKISNSHLFGQQYTGALAAQSFQAKFDKDSIASVAIRGNAVAAGGFLGVLDQSTLTNTYGVPDVRYLSAIYLGGMAGKSETLQGGKGGKTKTATNSRIQNNYVHLIADGSSRRVGGLVGSATNMELNNNYVYGTVSGTNYIGGVIGYVGSNVNVSNCYFEHGMAKNIWGYNTHPGAVQKSTTFRKRGNDVILTERVDGYENMLRALNRWVFTHGDSIYSTWRSAGRDENNGYPVFGDPEMITVRDSLVQSICDEMEWDGLTFTQSGRYIFHVVDSSDYLDSTFILNITVNHSDSTLFTDSIDMGQPYSGHGINLSIEQLMQLAANRPRQEVMALRYVDSLLSSTGCDSLVVLTLYVVNNNVDIDTVPQQMVDVRVYPNPTRGMVNVEGPAITTVEVYDNISRHILTINNTKQPTPSQHLTFDLSNYPSGAYYVRVRTANGSIVKKVIKK